MSAIAAEAIRRIVRPDPDTADQQRKKRLDRVIRMAQLLFDMPIALVGAADDGGHRMASSSGLAAGDALHAIGFCEEALGRSQGIVILEPQCDPRFANHPLATGSVGIRFFAGRILRGGQGEVLGTLSLFDTRSRQLSEQELAALDDLAGIAEEALAEAPPASGEEFRATFERAVVGMAHVAPDGTFLRVNQALCDLVGYSADELKALTFQHITFPLDLERDVALVDEILAGERQTYTLEKRYITKVGKVVWANLTVSALRDDAGRVRHFISVVENIHEKKEAELALQRLNAELEQRVRQRTRELQDSNHALRAEMEHRVRTDIRLKASEERFRTLVESAGDAFVAVNAEGIITDWNRASERIFGWRRNEAVGQPLADAIISPGFRDRFRRSFAKAVKSGRSAFLNRRIELPVRAKSGADVSVETTVTVYQIEGAKLFGAFLHDGTQRKLAARKAEEKQRLLDAVLDAIDIGVVACDSDGEVTLFNRAARRFHGFDATAENPGEAARQCVVYGADGRTPLDAADFPLARALRGDIVQDQELVIAPPGGPPRHLLASGRLMTDAREGRLGAVIALKDTGAIMQSEQHARLTAQRLRAITENLPVMIAHVDRRGHFLYINELAARYYGTTSAKLIGRHVSRAHLERQQEYDMIRPYVKRVLAGERVSFEGERQIGQRNVHYHATYLPDLDADGNPNGFFALGMDITERKNSELRQAQNEARLRTIADNLPVCISYVDRSLVYRFANASYVSWVGMSPRDMVGKTVADVIGADAFEKRKPYFLQCLAGEEIRFEVETRLNGETRILQSAYIPHLENGEVVGIYILSTDITSARQ
ncbi:PAS domain S-box-containing protein [Noviherbaspirillum humi]|uniref:PAS domain S-box-containing protein n=1 Tax=Noviherbaspirillum humi TaxID=1688639 RepID=A0A239LCX6_9BURK|nr:PAS domain S-box protein [Noviherbaspirillum humi]SNT27812.1 PAS domain S-box-containing protein [Noviherbaspirillum humi]